MDIAEETVAWCRLCGLGVDPTTWRAHLTSEEHKHRLAALPALAGVGFARCSNCGSRDLRFDKDLGIWICRMCDTLMRDPAGPVPVDQLTEIMEADHA